jgi:PKD repeat protein
VTLRAIGKKNDVHIAYFQLEVQGVIADASVSPNPAWVGETVYFTDLSLNAKSVAWDFGDGTTSILRNPGHFYDDPGTYTVTFSAFGDGNEQDEVAFSLEVIGSDLKVIVKDYETDELISNASVLLFASASDWYEGDYENAVVEEFTDENGTCYFTGLSYQRYYVDVYYQDGSTGWVNWLLGDEDIGWVETQLLEGGYENTFIAYADYVDFTSKKGTDAVMRPDIRPPLTDLRGSMKKSSGIRPLKVNKFSVKKKP